MEVVGKLLLLGGFLLAIICQIVIGILAFKRKFIEGIFCIFVPAYVLFYAMRQETRKPKILALWGGGLVISIIGVILLS